MIESWPTKKYNVIYADPPWSYSFKEPTASKGGSNGSGYSAGVDYYYKTMDLADIQNLPINDITEKDCVCFMWAVNPQLPEALDTMKMWGFTYKTTFTWHKERCKGMGYWFRGHTEFLLLGVKGHGIRAFRSLVHNIKILPVEQHSKKPDWFRSLIEEVTPELTRIELFARQKTNGWDVWGNEV